MRKYSRVATWSGALALVGLLTACAAPNPNYDSRYPNQPYPGQYPSQQYPAQQYPGQQYPAQQYPAQQYPNQGYTDYGRVNNIELLPRTYQRGSGSGVGAVLGAVVGGVLGNQVGGGSGRVAATAAGAVAGGLAGNALERRSAPGGEVGGLYRLTIQLDQGGQRVYDVPDPGDLRPGDRVRMVDGQISRY